ncbi:MAG: hypothetical protein JWO26_249 [Rhodospirillales bacterium]|jgi:hypothetical protein|nr:hypothetical protein [Rhodospirillales bacterium]MDB5380617.1 hypothetical protein [Rhodospirillales bacterium]
MDDPRRHAPATLRNREPILAALRQFLPSSGTVLEIASGSGEHAVFFAASLAGITWQPSDRGAAARASVDAHAADAALPNLLPALELNVTAAAWPISRADALLCCNMIHIAPWAATLGLMAGAARVLAQGAPLMLYGPFIQAGVPTAYSNDDFDADLRRRDPEWGLRDLDAVAATARGFTLDAIIPMPSNNLFVVFRRA